MPTSSFSRLLLSLDSDCVAERTRTQIRFSLAEVALIPDELWATFNAGAYASLADVIELANRAEVHPAIVAGRWQQQNREFRKFSKLLGHGKIRPEFPEVAAI